MNDGHDGSLKIHQNAKISRIDLKANNSFEYNLMYKNNGVYIMNITGNITIDEKELLSRDAIGIIETDKFNIAAKQDSQLLFIEIPML
jgi:redox-sensitive bicupin YhaK (pirin superfamily)